MNSRELNAITYPANTLFGSIVAVHKRCVRPPRVRRLVLELLAAIPSSDALLDLLINCFLDTRLDFLQAWC